MNKETIMEYGINCLIALIALTVTVSFINLIKPSITGFAVLEENATISNTSNASGGIITTKDTITNETIITETNTTTDTYKEKKEKEEKPVEKPIEKPDIEEKPKQNVPPVWKSDVNEIVVNGKTTIDLNNYFHDDNNDTITYTSTEPYKILVAVDGNFVTLTPDENNFTTKIEFTASDGDKSTTKEVKLIVPERSIFINLQYKLGTNYDSDDNGYEATYGVIDFTVENSKFSWDANESNLCTRWEIYSIEDGKSTTICNGAEKCCAFIGLAPTRDNWNEIFYSTYSQYGATLNNIVSAQVIHVDYGKRNDKPYAEIYYSPWQNLSANYYFASIGFQNVCVDTCILAGFNESGYKLIFEIENAVLNLNTLTYAIVEEISKVLLNLGIEDDRGLTSGSYQLYKNDTFVSIAEGFVEPDYYDIEVKSTENIIDKLVIENVNLTKPLSADIGIDNVSREISIENVDVKKRYAVNIEQLEFEKATLTATATANSLYKCRQWDYKREVCFGEWVKVKNLVVGEAYNLTLTKEDPGFIEGNVNITPILAVNITPVNITGLALIKDIQNIIILVNNNATIDLSGYFSNIDENTIFDYFKQDGISMLFDGGIVTIVPSQDFVGIVFTYIRATKNSDSVISNLFSITVTNITVTNVTLGMLDIMPNIILKKNDFKIDEDIDLDFEYLDKEELIEHNKWKEEYEVYEEETDKTEAEMNLLRAKIIKKEKQKKKWQKANESITAYLIHSADGLKDIDVEIEELREGKFDIKIPKQRAFRAGKYTLKLELIKDGATYTQEQDFTWGVLAINTHKSIYLPNEDAFIGIGVLDDKGKVVCNADVTLEITAPSNKKTALTTANGDIKISPECQVLGVTELPDYYTTYSVNGIGAYLMNLTAVTSNGVRSIQDNFTVQSSVDFDVARKGATRIYPLVPYVMNFTIIANKNYNGIINEYVPAGFEISEVGFYEVESQASGITLSAVEDTAVSNKVLESLSEITLSPINENSIINLEQNKEIKGSHSLVIEEPSWIPHLYQAIDRHKYINLSFLGNCVGQDCRGRIAWLLREAQTLLGNHTLQGSNLDEMRVPASASPKNNIKGDDNSQQNPINIISNFFTLIPSAQAQADAFNIITTVNDTKIIIIPVSLKKGSKYTVSYKFDAPDISPEFYVLGPLEIGAFKEARQWQIANDQAADVNVSHPDAGAPGMNLNVQFVGTGFTSGDSVSVNSSGNITIGPIVVTNANGDRVDTSGRVLSTVFYIHPNATQQDVKVTVGGQVLPTPFKIISLTGANKNDGNFSGFTSGTHMIGNGRNGTRTVRGTIVLDSLIIPSGVTVIVNTTDLDPANGVEGFLPVHIIVDGPVNISGILNVSGESGFSNAGLDKGGDGGKGGPGGGGGGGGGGDTMTGQTGGSGGSGFTGGGGGSCESDQACIEGSGGNGTGSLAGAFISGTSSIGGAGGNSTSPKATGGGGGSGDATAGAAGGGGTGFFFGSGGAGGSSTTGGTGGSGGGGGGGRAADTGGGGGFGIVGTQGTDANTGGSAHGNTHLVPLTGGSGGGGGGSGSALGGGGGGGGGGAVLIVAKENITIMPTGQILAVGGDGGSATGTNAGGIGGAGSGGGIVLQAPNISIQGALNTSGGTSGTAGGMGRIRIDGLDDPVTTTLIGLAGSNFTGPAIKNITDTTIGGTSNASASIIVYVQQKSGTNTTFTGTADANGQFDIAVTWYSGTNYIAVIQNSTVNTYTVMSSASVATYDFVVVPDNTPPVVNITNLNASDSIRINKVLNISAFVTGSPTLVNFTFNLTGNVDLYNFSYSVSGANVWASQNITVNVSRGNVINASVVACDSNNNCAINSTLITVANSPPNTPTIVLPVVGANTSQQPLELNITGSDPDGDAITTIHYYINGIFNQTSTTNTTFNASDGTYVLNVSISDGTVNSSNATTNFTLDRVAPVVGLVAPVNNSNSSGVTTFTFRVSSTLTPANDCQLFGNWSSTGFVGNQTENNPLEVPLENDFVETIDFKNNATHVIWNVRCNDTALNYGWNSSNFTLNIDYTVPLIALLAPANNTLSNGRGSDGNGVLFTYRQNESNPKVCQLWTNFSGTWQPNQTDTSKQTGVAKDFDSPINISTGSYIWNVGCNDSANNRGFNETNYTLRVDDTFPIVNTTFNITSPLPNDIINFSGNMSDETELLSANITYNISGAITYINFSLSGTYAERHNVTRVCSTACVINFTMYVTDTANNVKQNSTLITVRDTILPIVNTTFNITSPVINDIINFSGNITDDTGLLSANITYNISGAITYLNFTASGKTVQVHNVTQITCDGGCVINFTMYATDTANNVKQNSTLIVVADRTLPVVNTTFNITNPIVNDIINFSGNITDNVQLLSANITYNISGSVTYINFSSSGTSAQLHNVTQLTCTETCVINFTMYATDTSNNVKQNSTLITIADTTAPIVNTSINKSLTNILQNNFINLTANVTDASGLSFCQFIDNQSLANGAKQYINKSVTGTSDQCSQNYTIALAAGNVINFTVSVNDSRNNFRTNDTIITVASAANAPIIKLNNATGFAVDPIDAGTAAIYISFNVTDADGVTTINASKAIVNLTLGTPSDAQFRFNISEQGGEFGTCGNHTEPGPGSEASRVIINCTILLRYYDNASSNWVINVSVQDTSGQVGRNDTFKFTYNTLSAISLPTTALNFSSVFLGQQNVLAYPHLLVNNTGNDDFDMVNISATALVGTTTTSETIGVTNFGVNLTNSSTNLRLSFPSDGIVNLKDPTTGGNASFLHGHTSAFAPNADKGNISVFVWVNVPSSELSTQLYNATWNVTVINNP